MKICILAILSLFIIPNVYSQNSVEGFWKGHIVQADTSLELSFDILKNQRGL